MPNPSLELFTAPHRRGRTGDSKWAKFFNEMKMREIKKLPDELQDKKSVHGYVPKDIRTEFVFRTNPDDGQRYVARLGANAKPQRNTAQPTKANKPVASEPVKVTVPGTPKRVEPPKQFDSDTDAV